MVQAEMNVPGTVQEGKTDWRSQYREHLEQQPETIQRIHRWLGRLRAASLGLVVGVFAWALYLSVIWRQVDPREIALWWIVFAASGLPITICVGLDAIIVRAIGPAGKGKAFVTGPRAVASGWFSIVAGLAWSGLLVYLAYGVVTLHFDMIGIAIDFLTPVLTAVIVVSIVYSVLRDIARRLEPRS